MPITKNTHLRYKILEKCFSDTTKKYFIDDLIIACEEELESISVDTIRKDIKKMRDEYGAPIESKKDGKKAYYRYKHYNFSIDGILFPEDKKQLESIIQLLSRFKGLPHYKWIDEILDKIKSSFRFEESTKEIVYFENNPFLKGFENYFSFLFDKILRDKVLKITYQSFEDTEVLNWTIHPYILKEFNKRWYLIGFCEEGNKIYNIAFDRILNSEETDVKYITTETDFNEYFDDVIGVTVYEQEELQEIKLQFSENRFPYVKTKPIHSSQKVLKKEINTISIEVKKNNELISLILSYGKDVKVVTPIELQKEIKIIYRQALDNY
ncbi:WYL domain-containing protein [Tenacibaculum finnmarkense]|uniref:helix-turn-helix transcriptional regulator n=1 Tax=Tenacibaculum finnmarkense TaxID=2781243 RepID=UPI001EFBE97A|nr:WYL domain-containing protein [Tenacibaculum finnmarkense]MCG8807430.1 WYL domain-containing protein [Tenacibaculum finnmarkense]MCG8817649.1 WYL domain-containing protein [Tenacibaculum finnmarkense]